MRGAAKSLAILQGQLRYWLRACPNSNTIPAIEAFSEFRNSFDHKLAKTTPQTMADFQPK